MDYIYEYDEKDPFSIEKYAQRLIGRTFEDVCKADEKSAKSIIREDNNVYRTAVSNRRHKGGLGTLIEERFFHYPANDESRPDFPKAGVELKVSPYRIVSGGRKIAKERLIITMINYNQVVHEEFETSHLWQKTKLILLIYYLYTKDASSKLDYRIDYARLFTPPEKDLAIIRHDFQVIVNKIKEGKAHELSESDTLYLGAATKSSSSTARRSQPYSNVMAKPRAFALKNSYMTFVLNNYIIPGRPKYESIMNVNTPDSFEDFVKNKIRKYAGKTVGELCNIFDINQKGSPKNIGSIIAFRILGITGNDAEEFDKAGIKVKTIRIENNGRIKESMSFPVFKFNELIEQEWENSDFRNYLSETRFFFVVYQFNSAGELYLKGCQFWNIPYSDLEGNVRKVWVETKDVLNKGLVIKRLNGHMTNNFPKASDNPVCHVRPHARNAQDTYPLPDGRNYPKQCFWLNNTYILSQLDADLKR